MIYQPVNVYPNNSTIDASLSNTFSWVFNGDAIVKYKIDIYELNKTTTTYSNTVTPSNTIYGGDTITHDVPANSLKNGSEYIWKITQYESNPSMFVVSGVVVSASSTTSLVISTQMSTVLAGMSIVINGEYREISTYDSKTGNVTLTTGFSNTPAAGTSYSIYTPFTTTLNGFYIKARKTPVVTIDTLDSSLLDENGNLKYRSANFLGHYSQEQNVSIKYHNYVLTENNEVVDSTEDIYNSNLSYEFDGFLSNSTYTLTLNVFTQDNQTVNTSYTFNVLYNEPLLIETPTATFNPEHNSVLIDCQIIKVSEPTINGEYEFVDGFLHIKDGNITYEEVSNRDLKLENFTILTEFYLDTSVAYKILSILTNDESQEYYTSYEMLMNGDVPLGSHIVEHMDLTNSQNYNPLYKWKNNILPCLQNTSVSDNNNEYLYFFDMIFDLTGSQYFLLNTDFIDSNKKFKLAMSSTKCILQDSNGNKYSVDVNTNSVVFNKVRLFAGVFYNYLMVLNKDLSDEELNKFFDNSFTPSWDSFDNILIFAPFDDSLLSSNIQSLTTSSIKYIYIYRQKQGEHILHNIGKISLNQSYIEDLMVANDEIYTWYIVPVSDTELGVSIATNPVLVRFDEWTINPLVITGENNEFTTDATWKFGLNVTAEPYAQNILKTKFEGLSKYPKFTVEERNYISGGLSAYLSEIVLNTIIDDPVISELYDDASYYKRNSCIYYEPSDMLREWNDLVASGRPVLIRDLKGHIIRGQIDSNNASINIYNQVSPTTIQFTFTQTSSSDDISVIIKGAIIDGV